MESSRQQQVVGLDVSKAWLDGYLARADGGCGSAMTPEAWRNWSRHSATAAAAWW